MKKLLLLIVIAAAMFSMGALAPASGIAARVGAVVQDVCACGQTGYWNTWWHDTDGNPDTYGGHWDCAWIANGGGGGTVIHGC